MREQSTCYSGKTCAVALRTDITVTFTKCLSPAGALEGLVGVGVPLAESGGGTAGGTPLRLNHPGSANQALRCHSILRLALLCLDVC